MNSAEFDEHLKELGHSRVVTEHGTKRLTPTLIYLENKAYTGDR